MDFIYSSTENRTQLRCNFQTLKESFVAKQRSWRNSISTSLLLFSGFGPQMEKLSYQSMIFSWENWNAGPALPTINLSKCDFLLWENWNTVPTLPTTTFYPFLFIRRWVYVFLPRHQKEKKKSNSNQIFQPITKAGLLYTYIKIMIYEVGFLWISSLIFENRRQSTFTDNFVFWCGNVLLFHQKTKTQNPKQILPYCQIKKWFLQKKPWKQQHHEK